MNVRVTIHRINIERYESLLMSDVTPSERRYLENTLELERAAMMMLYLGKRAPARAA